MDVEEGPRRGVENMPWVEKYRPRTLDELLSHDQIISTLKKLIEEGRLPHLLFYGPPGTGKTSAILATARMLYGPSYHSMILELNASDERGINVVRQKIKDFASTRKLFSTGAKLVILDEADHMSNEAQAALRRVIEKFTKNTRFCLICNYVSKIIPALQSRCTRFRFGPLPPPMLAKMFDRVIGEEKIAITPEGREAVVTLSRGDMRKCLNILQATHMAYDKVDMDEVYMCTGQPLPSDIMDVTHSLLNDSFEVADEKIQRLQTEKGLALSDILNDFHRLVLELEGLSSAQRGLLLEHLGDIEHRICSGGANDSVQRASLVGACVLARQGDAMAV